jgi:hypothetical protein
MITGMEERIGIVENESVPTGDASAICYFLSMEIPILQETKSADAWPFGSSPRVDFESVPSRMAA